MKLLLEATLLLGDANYTTATFRKLLELRQTASGDEANRIGRLVETFIAQSPPDVLRQIMPLI